MTRKLILFDVTWTFHNLGCRCFLSRDHRYLYCLYYKLICKNSVAGYVVSRAPRTRTLKDWFNLYITRERWLDCHSTDTG